MAYLYVKNIIRYVFLEEKNNNKQKTEVQTTKKIPQGLPEPPSPCVYVRLPQ